MHKSLSTAVFLAAAIVCFTSSCMNLRPEFEASLDTNQQSYKGESYPGPSKNSADVGANVAMLWLYGRAASDNIESSYRQYTPLENVSTNTTYASGTVKKAGMIRTFDAWSTPNTKARVPNFMDNVYIMTGPQFVLKNSKDGDTKIKAAYLQLPVYAIYMHRLQDKSSIFGGLGPYLAYGLFGKAKSDDFKENTFDKEFGFKRFDAGLTFTGGYKFSSGIHLRLAHDLGLADIDRFDESKTRNRSWSLAVGVPMDKLIKK